jgi:hypothetical protein
MAFGVKVKNIKTKGSYSIEEFYEAIKDTAFSAGEPSLTKHGVATVITFPALDRQNQVWIMAAGGKGTKFSIQKSQQAGMGTTVGNLALDEVTNGFFGLGGMVGNNVKECERLVEETAKELDAIGL